MALFANRQRQKLNEEAEARGQLLWTREVPQVVRQRIANAYNYVLGELGDYDTSARTASRLLGLFLGTSYHEMTPLQLTRTEDDGVFFSFLEAFHSVIKDRHSSNADFFARAINHALNEHRVAYKFVPETSDVVELASEELHAEVVEPAIRLVHGREDLAKGETAYVGALKQISQHEPGNAITDAATALQETLAALGAQGGTLGEQIKNAKKQALLAGRDAPLLESIEKALTWVASERNQNSDAHNVTDATLDDAWLIVHIVGALIVRLAGSPRA